MDKIFALAARDLCLEAVSKLNCIVKIQTDWSSDELKELKKSIGITIGNIEIDILGKIYSRYEDIDDLQDQ